MLALVFKFGKGGVCVRMSVAFQFAFSFVCAGLHTGTIFALYSSGMAELG